MSEHARHFVRLVIAAVLFYGMGTMILQFSDYTFQQYVRTFYPAGTPNARSMQTIAVIAIAFQPACWYSSCIGLLYAHIRSPSRFGFPSIPMISGLIASFYGWASSAFVHADPGPNYSAHSTKVPFWCLIGIIVGCCISLTVQGRSQEQRKT